RKSATQDRGTWPKRNRSNGQVCGDSGTEGSLRQRTSPRSNTAMIAIGPLQTQVPPRTIPRNVIGAENSRTGANLRLAAMSSGLSGRGRDLEHFLERGQAPRELPRPADARRLQA